MAEMRRIHGVSVNKTMFCSCGEFLMYSGFENDVLLRGYDTHFCIACDEWFGVTDCGDPNCEYCAEKPARPSLVPFKMVVLDPGPPFYVAPPPPDPPCPEGCRCNEPRTPEEEESIKKLFAFFTRHTN